MIRANWEKYFLEVCEVQHSAALPISQISLSPILFVLLVHKVLSHARSKGAGFVQALADGVLLYHWLWLLSFQCFHIGVFYHLALLHGDG
ncbi:hypothetical protein CBR_g50952 [Chara braunii]|uniref:Uncharacterized protein n=1 Tax=Chara braunii TaxID=69332 RepID=A0A388M7P5_CHABU|nr:hypothetical protein CBR_g50952 [Chara braunii]|eukprot:GBG90608.1 hypothetical protein CBR_g50952 [Chara braunii]